MTLLEIIIIVTILNILGLVAIAFGLAGSLVFAVVNGLSLAFIAFLFINTWLNNRKSKQVKTEAQV